MNGTPSIERLSAWLDDELTPDERAEVEKLLAESPELRQEADELRRLSSHLKGLPVGQAPSDLQQAVMQSIRSQPEKRLAGDTVTSSARQERLLRRLVAAAGIALAVGAGAWFAGGDQEIVDNETIEPEIIETRQNRRGMAANNADLRSSKKLSVELPSRQFEIDRGALNSADIGDIVEAVRRDGESVSVVRLTVVDREAGLESLRVLLAHEDISLDGSTQDASVDSDLGSRGMVAVFVESPSDQLRRTIEQMARQLDLEALSVSNSLPIAELDSSVRSELGIADDGGKTRASRAVSVPEGSSLEKIITEPGSYPSSAEVSEKPVSEDSPVRVIFVLSNAPQSKPAVESSTSENGAA